MDLNTVITEVQSWSAEDRLKLIEEVWGGLSIEFQRFEVSEELRNLLDCRIEAPEQNQDAVITWEVLHGRRDPSVSKNRELLTSRDDGLLCKCNVVCGLVV